MNNNIFTALLDLLKVDHTKEYSGKHFREHPHKYNLFGLSSMLSHYNIENVAVKLDNKESDLHLLETPFVAHIDNDFALVKKLTPEKVNYIWKGKDISISPEEFNKIWSGVVLLAETNEQSSEPNYKENRKKELYENSQKLMLATAVGAIVTLTYFSRAMYQSLGLTFLFVINLLGIYIGYLLVLKQMHVHSDYADKICSLFKQSDCNNVLESEASKLWGLIGWSEAGLGYFISNMIIILFAPQLLFYQAIINVCVLPYSFWSIWYQKVKAKQWCLLCLIVQGIFWSLFIVNLVFGYFQLPQIRVMDLILTGSIYLAPFLCISIVTPKLSKGNQMENIRQEINSLKTDEDVFLAILKKQPYYEVSRSNSSILFGNPNSEVLITILTNPHCDPCSRMHTRIEDLLKKNKDKFCIQYVFSSFGEELDTSCHFLIDVYENNDTAQSMLIYNEWFNEGKYGKEDVFEKYHFDIKKIMVEYDSHKQWREQHKIGATPTILINGYQLPDNYKIEDLKFITGFNVNVK